MLRQQQRPDHKTLRNNWAFTGIFQPFVRGHEAHTQLDSPQLKLVGEFLQLPDFRGVHVHGLLHGLALPAELLLEVRGSGLVRQQGLGQGREAVAQGTGAGAQRVLRELVQARGQTTWATPKGKLIAVILCCCTDKKPPLAASSSLPAILII